MSASDDDFIDVAATVAASSSRAGVGIAGDGSDALRALSGHVSGGGDDGASTSSQHRHQSPSPVAAASAPPPRHSRRGGWFSSLFGGGGAFPARSKTVRRRDQKLGKRERERDSQDGKPWKKNFAVPSTLSLLSLLSLFSLSLSPPPLPLFTNPLLSLPLASLYKPSPLSPSSRHRSSTTRTSRE